MTSESRSPLSRARAVHEEWIQVTDSLRRIGHEFNQIVIDSLNESKVHRSRATELEARQRDLVTENNTFRANNEELKHLLELGQPIAGSTIESSGAAYRKLRHVRRVMRDLLEDLTMEFGDSPNEGSSEALLLQAEPRERTPVKELRAFASPSPSSRSRKNDTSSNSPSSGDTVRPRSSAGKARSSPAMTMNMPESSSASTSHSRASRTGVISPGNCQTTSTESRSSGSEPSVDVSVHPARKSSAGDGDDDLWRLSSSHSPRSAEVIWPLGVGWLQERLKLDEDTIYSLESLRQMDEHCFHVQIVDNMAFVHDPFSMDGPGESLLMDWGTPGANEKVREYIVRKRPRDRVLHTFIFPVKRGLWFYIGAHTWNMKDLFQVWPTLGDKAKEVVTRKLRRRCNQRHSQQDVSEMVQDGRLQQFCIEVSGRSLNTLSEEFAETRLGFERGKLAK